MDWVQELFQVIFGRVSQLFFPWASLKIAFSSLLVSSALSTETLATAYVTACSRDWQKARHRLLAADYWHLPLLVWSRKRERVQRLLALVLQFNINQRYPSRLTRRQFGILLLQLINHGNSSSDVTFLEWHCKLNLTNKRNKKEENLYLLCDGDTANEPSEKEQWNASPHALLSKDES